MITSKAYPNAGDWGLQLPLAIESLQQTHLHGASHDLEMEREALVNGRIDINWIRILINNLSTYVSFPSQLHSSFTKAPISTHFGFSGAPDSVSVNDTSHNDWIKSNIEAREIHKMHFSCRPHVVRLLNRTMLPLDAWALFSNSPSYDHNILKSG